MTSNYLEIRCQKKREHSEGLQFCAKLIGLIKEKYLGSSVTMHRCPTCGIWWEVRCKHIFGFPIIDLVEMPKGAIFKTIKPDRVVISPMECTEW